MFTLTNLLKSKASWLKAEGPFADKVISSRIRLARNLAPIRFPPTAPPREMKTCWEMIGAAAKKTREFECAAYVSIGDLEEVERYFLVERRLASPDLLRAPQHRAVIVGTTEAASLMVNEEDHLRLQFLAPGFSASQALEAALRIDDELGKHLPYAFRPDFGFLTSCPTNAGTGLRASLLVHLPALIATQNIEPVLQELSRMGLVTRGFYGEGSQMLGELFQISNAVTLGKTERELTEGMEAVLKKVLRHEQQMRERLFSGHDKNRVIDRVWRSYGILSQTRSISFAEAMQELSRLRLGLAQGIKFNGLNFSLLNELILLTQPAHIQMQAQKNLGPQERDAWRADLIRKTLKS